MRVVVTGWDAHSRQLSYVPVDGGSGGGEDAVTVPDWYADDVSEQCAGAPLPRVGELIVDDDGCLLEVTGPSARWCQANWRKRSVRLTENGAEVAELPAERLGLPDDEVTLRRVNQIGKFLLFDPAGPVAGCWVREGGLSGWLADEAIRRERAAKQKAEEEAAKQERVRLRELETERQEAQARREAPDRFVNPYTFVPFPDRIARAEPAGHDRLAPGRLSGRLVVRWRFTAPVQAPDGSEEGSPLRFPGSSVKGAVRSVHETLAGGCLRIVDEEFVPSYRDTASALSDEWTLAVVSEEVFGQPLRVRPADRVVWVRSGQLVAACGNGLRTGSRVDLDPAATARRLDRYELSEDAPVRAGGDWVVLLTDPGARQPTRKDGTAALYFAACGRITDSTLEREVDEEAWRTFRQAVAGAREVIQHRSENPPAPWPEVKFQDRVIGRRKAVTGRFEKGDVLWVRQDRAGRVVELRLSAIWRHPGAVPLGERIPPHLRPCPDPARPCADPVELCPSCRLFGSADTRARGEDNQADQRAYAGHVRFGDAVSAGPVVLERFPRAPLSAPRPGAGQFYLAYKETAPARKETSRPTREWGADPDRPKPRPVRGRKFYWHTEPGDHPPWHRARPHHRPQMVAEKLLAPLGTTLTQTITFDNLDLAELGGLLAALRPDRAVCRGDAAETRGPLRLHLGGGKPLGLGSCDVTVADVEVWDAASRYGGGPDPAFEQEAAIEAFVAACPAEVTATWPALAAVLAAGTVNPARVWYPPGADWTDRERKPKQFDEAFAFFTVTSGMYLKEAKKGKKRPLLPLPKPTELDQTLPIIHKAHTEHRPEERLT